MQLKTLQNQHTYETMAQSIVLKNTEKYELPNLSCEFAREEQQWHNRFIISAMEVDQ